MPQVNFRVTDEEKQGLEEAAKRLGYKGMTDFFRGAVLFFGGLDPVTWAHVRGFAKRIGLAESRVVMGILLKWFADAQAQAEVFGKGPQVFPEFATPTTGNGAVDGERLLETLKKAAMTRLRPPQAPVEGLQRPAGMTDVEWREAQAEAQEDGPVEFEGKE